MKIKQTTWRWKHYKTWFSFIIYLEESDALAHINQVSSYIYSEGDQIISVKKCIYLLILHSTTSTEILTEIKN